MPEPAFGLLVDTATLARHLDDTNWILFDCRFDLAKPTLGRDQYQQGHIPQALYADLDQDLSGPIGPYTGRHPLPDPDRLSARLAHWGVEADRQVVVYDDVGGGFAVRLWWLLRWLGHDRIAVLNGGLRTWISEGREMTNGVTKPAPAAFAARIRDDTWVSTDTLAASLETGRFQVVDARTAERFRGGVEPIDPIAGHIPGAVNLPLLENLDETGRFLPPKQLRDRFLTGIADTPPERILHSCGSGVNACHNLLAMEIAGLTGSRLYAGSWSEWIKSPARPVATGHA